MSENEGSEIAQAMEHPPEEAADELTEAQLVKQQLSSLVSDFRHLAAAEIEYLKVRAAYSGHLAKRVSIFIALGLFGLLATLVGLIVGLLLILSVYLGPIMATIIVVAAFILLSIGAGLAARHNARLLVFSEDEKNG